MARGNDDIVIVGAGPAGLAAALFLAKQGIASRVLEKAVFPRDKVCGDAMSGKVVEVLKKLEPGWVDELNRDAHFLPSWGVTFVSPSREELRVPFRSNKNPDDPAPGFLSRRTDQDFWLYRKAKENPLIDIKENTAPASYSKNNGRWEIKDDAGNLLASPRLIIACDGAHSRFAKEFGGMKMEPLHHCAGVRAYYKNVKGTDAENFIELHFLKDFLPGYFWIFPLPGGYANVGVGMRSDRVSAKKINLKKEMERILREDPVFRDRFADAELQGSYSGFGLPLGSKKRRLSGEGFLLCGDAASLIDPFTGEGIGNAMMSGMFAAKQAEQSLLNNDFSADALSHYDEAVYARLGGELRLSTWMQRLVNFPWLFNLVVRKANRNAELSQMISCMFEDLDLRDKLRKPGFYLRLLFN